MAEDDDKPEDEDKIENPAEEAVEATADTSDADTADDEDDSDLFEPPSDDQPDEGEDPLGDALAEAAAGEIPGDSSGAEDDEDDDSDLFQTPHEEEPSHEEEPPHEEETGPEAGGRQPVLPTTPVLPTNSEEDNAESDDLFGSDEQDNDDKDDDDEPQARQRYPWLKSSGKEEEEELEEAHSLQGRTLIFVGAAVVFVIFSALIWFLYAQGDDAPRDQDVALIEAPEGPAKVVPEDRGGMEVPDQDKLVYDRVSGQETELEEKLLAGPEEPMIMPESVPEQTAGSLDELLESVRDDSPTDVEAAPVAAEEPEVVAEAEPVEAAPVETTPPLAVNGGTHMVQLASYGSSERAEIGWRTIKNRHSILLSGLATDIQRADLGARGVVYRLRTEVMGEVDARDLCADLKAAGQDCLVVRR